MAAKPAEMRVLHIVPSLFDANDGVLGGAERYALELARYMAEEVSTRLVTFGEHDRLERVGNLEVRVIGQPGRCEARKAIPSRSPFSLNCARQRSFIAINNTC
jgi:hypothetical protein